MRPSLLLVSIALVLVVAFITQEVDGKFTIYGELLYHTFLSALYVFGDAIIVKYCRFKVCSQIV